MAIKKKGEEKFSSRQKKILITFTETLLPPGVGTPFRATEKNLISPSERLLKAIGSNTMRGFGLLLYIFEFGTLVLTPYFKPFSRLDPDRRERYMEGWDNSRISIRRQIFTLLKFMICMCILSDKDIRASLGYDPDCLVEIRR